MQSFRVLFLLALSACASAGKGDLQGTASHLQKCTYEWYDKYIHSWKKKFGACVLKGC